MGASFAWAGNSKVGEGNMTITESKPQELVVMRLEFLKPFAAVNTTEFTLQPEGSQTRLTWTMSGKQKFIFKLMNLVMSCNKMVGGMFESGLKDLKALAEGQSS